MLIWRPTTLRWLLPAALVLRAATTEAAEPSAALNLSGSVKTILLRSRSVTGDEYTWNLNRLRLELKGDVAPGLAIDLQYDNEVLLGSYLKTQEFAMSKDRPPPQYWRADANYVERGDVYGRHRLYRAAVTVTRGDVDVRVGRQRIAWGTGRFWSPLDILNPPSPLALEREERIGVDAALLEAKLGPLSRASVVYAPAPTGGSASRAVQWHGNAAGIDGSLVAGRLGGFDVAGMDLASQIGQVGVRAEAARMQPAAGSRFNRWTVGADYALSFGLTISAELYRDGAGRRDPRNYDWGGRLVGRISTLANRYAGLALTYEITPLTKWVTYVVRNGDDRSRAIDSRLVWSIDTSADLTVGLQRFVGRQGSEFNAIPNAAQLQLQWYFQP